MRRITLSMPADRAERLEAVVGTANNASQAVRALAFIGLEWAEDGRHERADRIVVADGDVELTAPEDVVVCNADAVAVEDSDTVDVDTADRVVVEDVDELVVSDSDTVECDQTGDQDVS